MQANRTLSPVVVVQVLPSSREAIKTDAKAARSINDVAGVTVDWFTSTRTLDPLSGADPADHPLSIRSPCVLLVVVLSAWVLGAALRFSSELFG